MRVTPSHVFLGVALAASLAVNAVALWPGADPAERRAPPPRRAIEAPKAKPAASPAEELRACEDRLKARQAKDALRSLAAGLRASRDEKPEGKGEDREHAEILCRIAEKQMRDRWRDKAKETLEGTRNSLADAAAVERNAVKDAAAIAKDLGLSASETDRFTERFRTVRLESVRAANVALGKDPVDYAAMQDAVRRNFKEEVRLLAEMFGDATAERYAASTEEGELTVLAIIAAIGGLPLPDPLR
jgi:hypothetical protein